MVGRLQRTGTPQILHNRNFSQQNGSAIFKINIRSLHNQQERIIFFDSILYKKTSKNPTQKYHKKYNNPHPTLNILYSNLQATLTLPAKHPLKYNKPPPFSLPNSTPRHRITIHSPYSSVTSKQAKQSAIFEQPKQPEISTQFTTKNTLNSHFHAKIPF